jgi:hypothetical protein
MNPAFVWALCKVAVGAGMFHFSKLTSMGMEVEYRASWGLVRGALLEVVECNSNALQLSDISRQVLIRAAMRNELYSPRTESGREGLFFICSAPYCLTEAAERRSAVIGILSSTDTWDNLLPGDYSSMAYASLYHSCLKVYISLSGATNLAYKCDIVDDGIPELQAKINDLVEFCDQVLDSVDALNFGVPVMNEKVLSSFRELSEFEIYPGDYFHFVYKEEESTEKAASIVLELLTKVEGFII